MINKYFALSLVATSVALASCSSDDDDDDDNGMETPDYVSPEATPGVGGSVYDYLFQNQDQFGTLVTAIDTANLDDTLDDETLEFTVFAPDEAAFAALTAENPDAVTDLLADTDALTRVLQYHVVEGTNDAAAIGALVAAATEEAPAVLESLIEEDLTFTSVEVGQGIAVNGVALVATDGTPEVAEGETTTGVVHQIGEVLMPPEETDTGEGEGEGEGEGTGGGEVTEGAGTNQAALESAGVYTSFLGAFSPQAYDDAVNVWTVFAPTDQAVSDAGVTLDTDGARDHIVDSGALTVEDLIAAGEITTNLGNTYPVAGTDETDLLVGGNPVTLLSTNEETGTIVYSIDGVLMQ